MNVKYKGLWSLMVFVMLVAPFFRSATPARAAAPDQWEKTVKLSFESDTVINIWSDQPSPYTTGVVLHVATHKYGYDENGRPQIGERIGGNTFTFAIEKGQNFSETAELSYDPQCDTVTIAWIVAPGVIYGQKTLHFNECTPPTEPTCNVKTSVMDEAEKRISTTVSWENANEDWHILTWGDGSEVGFFGASGSETREHQFADYGEYTQEFTVTGPGGTKTCSDTVTFEAPANLPPVAVAHANPPEGTAPLTVNLDGSESHDPDGQIVSYSWDLGDGSTSDEMSPVHIYAEAGNYEATLTVVDDDGATDSDSVMITVGEVVPPTEPTCNVKTSVMDEAEKRISTTVSWENANEDWHILTWGDGSEVGFFGMSGNETREHQFADYGTYTQMFTVTGPGGSKTCKDSVTFEAPANLPPVAVAHANPNEGTAPLTVNLDGSESHDPDGQIVSYSWDLGDGSTSDEMSPVHTYNEAGTYEAVLTVTDDDGATDTDSVTIVVGTLIPPVVDVCPNLEGDQPEVPVGYYKADDGNCYPVHREVTKLVTIDKSHNLSQNGVITATFIGDLQQVRACKKDAEGALHCISLKFEKTGRFITTSSGVRQEVKISVGIGTLEPGKWMLFGHGPTGTGNDGLAIKIAASWQP